MITTVEKVLFLKSVDLFSQIPGEDLAQIALITNEETRENGEEIVAEGEVGDALYIVLEGKVRLVVQVNPDLAVEQDVERIAHLSRGKDLLSRIAALFAGDERHLREVFSRDLREEVDGFEEENLLDGADHR